MASSGGFTWEGQIELGKAIEDISPGIRRAMVAAAEFNAPKIASSMKSQAKWTDRTGNARNGLSATTAITPDNVQILMFYSVPYGLWLEVRWSGKYAVVGPAVQEWFPKVMDTLGKLIQKELQK
jgi:hypothetical protein